MIRDEEDEQELIEHTVEIDEYVSATIRIPKVLTAIDLKALMYKANKLFNIAEVPLVAVKKRVYHRSDYKGSNRLVNEYDSASKEERLEMAERLGINAKLLYQRVWGLKKDVGINKVDDRAYNRVASRKYDDAFVNKAVKKLKAGVSTKDVALKMGVKTKKLYDLVVSRTGKTPKQLRDRG